MLRWRSAMLQARMMSPKAYARSGDSAALRIGWAGTMSLDNETYSEEDAKARAEAARRRMLATLPNRGARKGADRSPLPRITKATVDRYQCRAFRFSPLIFGLGSNQGLPQYHAETRQRRAFAEPRGIFQGYMAPSQGALAALQSRFILSAWQPT